MSDEIPGFEAGPRIWLQLLEHEWDYARDTRRRLKQLSRPNFSLSPLLTRTLGRWDPATRTITLSEALLQGRRWHLVVSTLRHEMAHQVVSELYGAPPEPPHGPAFTRACALLGTSPAAAATPAELEQQREEPRIVRTVRGLLALSGSPNRHEAEAALARAQELALKHNISLAASPARRRYACRLLDRPRKRWPSYTWTILHTCEQLHQVHHIRWRLPDGEAVVELTGAPENLDLAEYAYHYLVHTGEAEWLRFRQRRGLRNNRQRLSFMSALYSSFDDRLSRQRRHLVTSQALVLHPDRALDAFYRARHPRVYTSACSGHQHHPEAGAAGAQAGARLQIKPGLGAGARPGRRPRGLLPGWRG